MNKIIIFLLIFVVIISIGATYYKYMILHDYVTEIEVECDPTIESCFVWTCDSEFEQCTGDEAEDTWYYKLVFRSTESIASCEANPELCETYSCQDQEENCFEVTCTEDNLLQYGIGGQCSGKKIDSFEK